MEWLLTYVLVGLLLAESGQSAACRRGRKTSVGGYVVTLTVWPYILICAILTRR